MKNFTLRVLIGKILNPFNPGYGKCYRCNRNWNICKGHITDYQDGNGVFPLCEDCWQELTPTSRLRYYRMMWNYNGNSMPRGKTKMVNLETGELEDINWGNDKQRIRELRLIEKAVLKGF